MLKFSEALSEVSENFNLVHAVESDNRVLALEDLRFAFEPGAQWEEQVVRSRSGPGVAKRPMYEYNRILPIINQLVGDQRQNRAQIKYKAADGSSDPDFADILTGYTRNLWNVSDGETAIDNAYTYALTSGFGVFRLNTQYIADDSFDQDIRVLPVWNPFTCFADPSSTDITHKDGNWWTVTERMSQAAFEIAFPKKAASSLPDPQIGDRSFINTSEIRVGEFYRKVRKNKTIALLSDGRVIDYTKDIKRIGPELAQLGITITQTRVAPQVQVEWYKLSGSEFLAEPVTYDWKYIPIIPVYGRRINIEGRTRYAGIVRTAKDPQRTYNYLRTTAVETAAMSPRAPYLVTPRMVEGYETQWADSHAKLRAYLKYNVDPQAPTAKPYREPPPDIPGALLDLAREDVDDIHSVTGQYQANLGAPSNEKSGKAIIARQREGDVGAFYFVDNLSKAYKYAGECIVDMLPSVLDTARRIRLLGEDGAEDFVDVNKPQMNMATGQAEVKNPVGKGRYDVFIDVGPSYTSQRQEAAEKIIDLMQAMPQLAQVAPDLIVAGLDIPQGDELIKRLRKPLLISGMVQPNKDEMEEMQQIQQQQQAAQQKQAQAEQLQIGMATTKIQEQQAKADSANAHAQKASQEAIGQHIENVFAVAVGPQPKFKQNEGD